MNTPPYPDASGEGIRTTPFTCIKLSAFSGTQPTFLGMMGQKIVVGHLIIHLYYNNWYTQQLIPEMI